MPKEGDNKQQIAHVRKSEKGDWVRHELRAHLHEVATMAGNFAQDFCSGQWASLAGLWHDLGKYKQAFQSYIRTQSGYEPDAHIEGGQGRVDHSTAGAIHAIEQLGPHGRVLAYLIAGHHERQGDRSDYSLWLKIFAAYACFARPEMKVARVKHAWREGSKSLTSCN